MGMKQKIINMAAVLLVIILMISCANTGGKSTNTEKQNDITSIIIKVSGDRAGRIHDALSKVILETDVKVVELNPKYICEVEVTISEINTLNNPNKFVRIELNANIKDKNNTVLHTWSYSERQGHTAIAEAENRAYSSAEKRISTEFKEDFKKFLLN